MYEIQQDVPVPDHARRNGKYPWAEMKVGDSFFVGCTPAKKNARKNTVRSAWNAFRKNHSDRKFTLADEEGGFRVWRIK